MHFADGLTLARLVIVPFFLGSFLLGNYTWAFILFVIAGVTDLIDGSIARILKQQTRFGALLDPIADKALMVTTAACLLVLKILPLWFFLILSIRDISILTSLWFLERRRIAVELKPVWSSKIATLSNILLVVFGFLAFLKPGVLFFGFPFQTWFQINLWISTFLVFISGFQYGWIGLQIIKKSH